MLSILILALSTVAFCAFLIAISYFLAPKGQSSPNKRADYECGIPAKNRADRPLSVKFFLTAILFILFDIEIIFLYPFAVAYREILQSEQAPGILLAMGLFLLLFVFGLWWEIKTRALDWN